jgi:hypothetical protein
MPFSAKTCLADGMGSLAKQIAALETTEKVIAMLTLSPERDAVIDKLIAASG